MKTVAEWYEQQLAKRDVQMQKDRAIMSNILDAKINTLRNKSANDKTVQFYDQQYQLMYGDDYEGFKSQLNIPLEDLQRQFPEQYGKVYGDFLDIYSKNYNKEKGIIEGGENINWLRGQYGFEPIDFGENVTEQDVKRAEMQTDIELDKRKQAQEQQEDVSNDINKAWEKYNQIKASNTDFTMSFDEFMAQEGSPQAKYYQGKAQSEIEEETSKKIEKEAGETYKELSEKDNVGELIKERKKYNIDKDGNISYYEDLIKDSIVFEKGGSGYTKELQKIKNLDKKIKELAPKEVPLDEDIGQRGGELHKKETTKKQSTKLQKAMELFGL